MWFFEYQCISMEVPLAEIKHCVRAAPVILQGVLQFQDLDSLVTTPHPEVIPYHQNFPMLLETTKSIWIAVNQRISQVEAPGKLHDRIPDVNDDNYYPVNTRQAQGIVHWNHAICWDKF